MSGQEPESYLTQCHHCKCDLSFVVGQPRGEPIFCDRKCYDAHRLEIERAVAHMRIALQGKNEE